MKDQGYESDSTLVFRKKENSAIAPLSPVEQKQAYLSLQAGGEAPIQGFRKPAPEKPRGMYRYNVFNYFFKRKKAFYFFNWLITTNTKHENTHTMFSSLCLQNLKENNFFLVNFIHNFY